jgi:hypothetical protein
MRAEAEGLSQVEKEGEEEREIQWDNTGKWTGLYGLGNHNLST